MLSAAAHKVYFPIKRTSQYAFLRSGAQVFQGRAVVIFYTTTAQAMPPQVHIGITVNKKVGGAVARNSVKRRLRAAVDSLLRLNGNVQAHHSVQANIVARPQASNADYATLQKDVHTFLHQQKITGLPDV